MNGLKIDICISSGNVNFDIQMAMPPLLLLISLLSLHTDQNTSVKSTSDLLQQKFHYTKDQSFLLVNIQKQEMYLVRSETIEKTYRISSAEAGIGNKAGSGKTPLGVHCISEKFGAGAKPNTI